MSSYNPQAGPPGPPGPPGDPDMGTCRDCGEYRLVFLSGICASCADPSLFDDEPDRDPDDMAEPIGSCDECGANLYPDDEWDGLCGQCAWHAQQ